MATTRPGPGGRPPGWQQEHARRYLATGGQDGHIWEGLPTLLLTTHRAALRHAANHAKARARTATGAEKPKLWKTMTAVSPLYVEYQARTTREIPVVIIERV